MSKMIVLASLRRLCGISAEKSQGPRDELRPRSSEDRIEIRVEEKTDSLFDFSPFKDTA